MTNANAVSTNVVKLKTKTSSLAERAILVNLKIGVWDGFAYSEEATLDGFGGKGIGRANKALLSGSAQFKKTKSAYNAVRAWVNQNTVPWKDSGVRMLPSNNYMEFTHALSAVKQAAELELTKLESCYLQDIADDRNRFANISAQSGKASLFDAADYPVNISDKFYIKLGFEPVPSSGDFRVQISKEDAEALDTAVMEAEEAVTKHLIEEMAKPMRALAEHLSKPIEDIKRFHESIVTNVYDQVDRLRKLNINNDPNVTALIVAVRDAFATISTQPEILKTNSTVRGETKEQLDEILKSFGV